jgi:hypothetical protein
MTDSKRIFISHAWSETVLYETFVASVDARIGSGNWINLSIPKGLAIEPGEELRNKSELQQLTVEIQKLVARLKDPLVPQVASRYVYGPEGRREVETKGMLLKALDELVARRNKVAAKERRDVSLVEISKGVSVRMREAPELALEIRERIAGADYFFILLSEMLLFRRWVDFEMEVASDAGIRTIAVDFGSNAGRHVEFKTRETATWARFDQGAFEW